MPISVSCQCGKHFQAPDRLAGRAVKCPSCGNPLAIPSPRESGPLDDLSDLESATELAQTGSASGIGGDITSAASGIGLGGSSLSMVSSDNESSPLRLQIILGEIIGAICLILVAILIFRGSDEPDTPLVADHGRPLQDTPQDEPSTTDAQDDEGSDVPPSKKATSAKPDRVPVPESEDRPRPKPSGDPPPDRVRRGYVDRGMGMGRPRPSREKTNATDRPGEPSTGSMGATGEEASSASPAGKSKRKLPEELLKWYNGNKLIPSHVPRGVELPELQYGWMVELLPYLGHQTDYDKFQFDKTWQHKQNAEIVRKVIPEFLNPLDNRKQYEGFRFPGLGLTHFVGMSGVEDSRNVTAAKLPRSDPRAGVFGYTEIAQRHHITDGTSRTIMLIGSGRLAGPWAINGGYTVRGARPSKDGSYFDHVTGFGSRGNRGRNAIILMADGSARWIDADIDPKVFRAMCTIHGGELVERETTNHPTRPTAATKVGSGSFFLNENP